MTDTIDRLASRTAFRDQIISRRPPMNGNGSDNPTAPALLIEEEALIVSEPVTRPSATFDDVLERHQTALYRFAVHLTRNRPDADDLYQETLLKAFRAFGRLDGAANHRAWLYKIASNTFLAERRKQGRLASLDAQPHVTIAAHDPDRAACLDARALLRELDVVVERLPPKQRLALVLRKYHGQSYGAIAATLGCNEEAARANVHQALRKLRDHFGERL